MKISYPDFEIEFKEVETEKKYLNLSKYQYLSNKKSLLPAIFDKLESQQSQNYFNFRQCKISSKIQIVFIEKVKVYRNYFPPKSVNYQ